LYNPVTGWFTGPDPVYGGNDTAYTYPTDPVNEQDLDGLRRSRKRGWRHRVGRNPYWQTSYYGGQLIAYGYGLGQVRRGYRGFRGGYRTYRTARRTGNYRVTRVRVCGRRSSFRCGGEGFLAYSGVKDFASTGRNFYRANRRMNRHHTRWVNKHFVRMAGYR
jgi:hypothetical protein